MISKHQFHTLGDFLWELPVSFRPEMRVPVRLLADDDLLEDALKDSSMEQAVNVACLPELTGVVVMPDVHQGYGMPIGGVMAAPASSGLISPGAVGYDINCGVRMLSSGIRLEEAEEHLEKLASALYRNCPSGVGEKGSIRLTEAEFDRVCREGNRWAVKNNYASQNDLNRTEESGCMEGADPSKISARAKERGKSQLGTLGSGNHFLEVDVVEQVFNQAAAQAMGLQEGCLAVQIHCGSRGFGHQVCTDYVHEFQTAVKRYGIQLADRELACAPLESTDGQAYFAAMKAAANFAFANRQVLAWHVRRSFEEVLAGKLRDWELRMVYDVTHNMAKVENYTRSGKKEKLLIHRKGATRALAPGAPDLPAEYASIGQPVLVPGSMGTASWVLAGAEAAMELSFGSCCHGAGRMMSRAQAKRRVRGDALRKQLEARGIHIQTGSLSGLAEEAPEAYKDVDRVIRVVCGAGIAKKVARLTPLAVIKG